MLRNEPTTVAYKPIDLHFTVIPEPADSVTITFVCPHVYSCRFSSMSAYRYENHSRADGFSPGMGRHQLHTDKESHDVQGNHHRFHPSQYICRFYTRQ
jgi:hypothetical protein